MRTLGKTIQHVERSATYGLRRLPGADRVLDLLSMGRPPDSRQTLMDSIGKVVLVGDFSYEYDPQRREHIARRVVKILKNQGVIDMGSSVDIRIMAPDTTEREGDFMSQTAVSLKHAFEKDVGRNQYVHDDPVIVPLAQGSELTAQASSCISGVAPGCAGEAFGDRLVVVGNPVFLARAFPHLNDHNLQDGGVAVLAEANGSPDTVRFTQLWPASASPPLVEKVA